MVLDYKIKYTKYKKKYLELQNKLKNKSFQQGGMVLNQILFEYDPDRFISYYNHENFPEPNGENKNSFEILLNLIDTQPSELEKTLGNILVGATCTSENDYLRFKDSLTYSLYIDNRIEPKPTAENQYHMYTIDYMNLNENNNYTRLPANSVNQIHFDTGTSYFSPIKYLEMALHLLAPGGKIIWDLLDHGGTLIFYRNGVFIKSTQPSTPYSELELNQLCRNLKISINKTERKITPLNETFFDSNTISPQIPLSILENVNGKYKRFELCANNDFVRYCRRRFPQFIFREKTYTLADYTYPVPIRIIDDQYHIRVYNEVVELVVNEVMTQEERKNYVDSKKISDEKLNELIDRINVNNQLKKNIIQRELIPRDLLEILVDPTNPNEPMENKLELILNEFIMNKFKTELKYIEAEKLPR